MMAVGLLLPSQAWVVVVGIAALAPLSGVGVSRMWSGRVESHLNEHDVGCVNRDVRILGIESAGCESGRVGCTCVDEVGTVV